MQCSNNLRQIGLALHNYHQALKSFPPGNFYAYAPPWLEHCWATMILPYMEQEALHDGYDYSLAWNDPGNAAVTEVDLSVHLCPSSKHTYKGQGDYAGQNGGTGGGPSNWTPEGSMASGMLLNMNPDYAGDPPGRDGLQRIQPVAISEVRDGTSNTWMVLEDAGRSEAAAGRWADGQQVMMTITINVSRANEMFSDHPGGAQALMVDGSVHFFSETMDWGLLGPLSTRAHGEVVSIF